MSDRFWFCMLVFIYYFLHDLFFYKVSVSLLSPEMQDIRSGKPKDDAHLTSPERQKRSSAVGKRQTIPPALRLMSPWDSDQEQNDLEVASVLEGGT